MKFDSVKRKSGYTSIPDNAAEGVWYRLYRIRLYLDVMMVHRGVQRTDIFPSSAGTAGLQGHVFIGYTGHGTANDVTVSATISDPRIGLLLKR